MAPGTRVSPMTGAETLGLDQDALTAWFAAHVPGAAGGLAFTRLPGGRSNLSFGVETRSGAEQGPAGPSWVLRRPPLGRTLPTAHDMSREVRVLRALRRSTVPVPAVVATCDDPGVTGAPFYVMEYVHGIVCRGAEAARRMLGRQARRAAGHDLVDVLVRLHHVDPAAVGLGAYGRPDRYVERQLRRWHGQWESDRTRELPELDEAHTRLSARVPGQVRTSIVHGDYRLDNCLLGPDGVVRGVLDWEISTLGDPRADLATMLAYWAEPEDLVSVLVDPPTVVEGFPARAELVARYLAAVDDGGATARDLDYFVAFAWWRIACIIEGVYARASRGSLGDTDRTAESFGAQSVVLARHALELVRHIT